MVWATEYWPSHVFAFLLSAMEVNINLTTTYFCEQEQMSQIKFHKLLVKTLIYSNHYNEEMDERRLAIVSSCSPYNFFRHVNHHHKQCISTTQVYDLQERVCTYCLCSPVVYQCAECIRYHLDCSKNNLLTPS